MNRTLTAATLLLAFGLATAAGAFAAGPRTDDSFKEKREKPDMALCHDPSGDAGHNFLEAARHARLDLVKCFIEERGSGIIHATDDNDANALMLSALKNEGEAPSVTAERDAIFDYLLAKDPALIRSKNMFNTGILSYMAMNHYTSRMEKALALGADMNEMDNLGYTPYTEALAYNNHEVVAIFEKFAKEHGIVIDKNPGKKRFQKEPRHGLTT